jgi:DNA-binding response OmpR family regulator
MSATKPANEIVKTPTIAGYSPEPRELPRALERHRGNRILSVSSAREDHAALRHILYELPWRITAATTCVEAKARLNRLRVSIILCERDLPDGSWKDLLSCISDAAERPLLIVTSRFADEYLWAEVLNLGGYDVLAKPFRDQEVRHVLASAWVQKINPVQRACTGSIWSTV